MDDDRITNETLAAIHGAIGWISATTNEGNHHLAHHTCKELSKVARLVAARIDAEQSKDG